MPSPRVLTITGLSVLLVAALSAGCLVLTRQGPSSTQTQRVPPAGSGSPPLPGSPSGKVSATPTQALATAGPAAPGGSGVSLRQVDGGPSYYGRFSPSLPTSPSYFPIGVWFEGVVEQQQAIMDKDAGINTYVMLTGNTDLSIVRNAGMYAIQNNLPGPGSETVGWVVSDEADMWGGPGNDRWTGHEPGGGDICEPADGKCGYTVQDTLSSRLPKDKRLRYANYGKGVTFWESTAEASVFVNKYQDVVSVDNYWMTDTNICSWSEGGRFFRDSPESDQTDLPQDQCRRPANYGKTVDKVRSMISPSGSKPVWNFVELGHPSSENESPTITAPQVEAAVWSSLIHGARGIIYFNHSFGGSCPTQHILREPCYAQIRGTVQALNARILRMAPVLNAPFADDIVTVTGGADVSAKWYDGHFYLLAGSTEATSHPATFSLPCVGDATVEVLDERRTIEIRGGTFSDMFADANAVHLYRVNGGSGCGAY